MIFLSSQNSTAQPASPPSADSVNLSPKKCTDDARCRVAPIAKRTAISFLRSEPRTS